MREGATQLERELAAYRDKLPELVQHEGKYVLIHGDSVADVFATSQDALRQGHPQFGLEPFLVKQILSTERIRFVARAIAPVAGWRMPHLTVALDPVGGPGRACLISRGKGATAILQFDGRLPGQASRFLSRRQSASRPQGVRGASFEMTCVAVIALRSSGNGTRKLRLLR